MVMSKRALPRRTLLRGIGAVVALPWLDAMVPAFTSAAAATKPVKRLGVVYLPNGVIVRDLIPPTPGAGFEITPILRPLEAFRHQLTVISGLANVAGDPVDAGSGPHSRTSGCYLSGVRVKHTESADLRAGRTMDQFAADELGQDTPLRSLELALEPNFTVGGCEGGYSCTYINTFSWAAPDRPLPMETNPAVVFERLFGDGATGAARLARMRRDRSILDAVTASLNRLQRVVGPGDRQTLDEYFDAVRDVERRVQQAGTQGEASPEGLERPFGIPALFEDHARLMFDLMYLAFRADLTRVVTFQLGRELSLRAYPEIGVPEAHHAISHHGHAPEKIAACAKINEYHMQLFSHLVGRMASTADGDGSLLDHSILLAGGAMGDSDLHSPHNLPTVLVGSGCGQVKPGRHVRATFDTPFMNLCLNLLDKVDVHLDRLGDSTGRLADV
jgi:hypothetical protein